MSRRASPQAVYSTRRAAAEALWRESEKKARERGAWAAQLEELKAINAAIRHKANYSIFRCVYQVREGQDFDFESLDGGSYSDHWSRSYQFNLSVVDPDRLEAKTEEGTPIDAAILDENESQAPPVPGVPITILLQPQAEQFGPLAFFSGCLIAGCGEPISGANGDFLTCAHHAPLAGTVTAAQIAELRSRSLVQAIGAAKAYLAADQVPDPVIDVPVTTDGRKDTIHVDLVSLEVMPWCLED